jgi:hypothetical protein
MNRAVAPALRTGTAGSQDESRCSAIQRMGLRVGAAAAQKVEQQHDQAYDQNDVNQAGGHVKREKT